MPIQRDIYFRYFRFRYFLLDIFFVTTLFILCSIITRAYNDSNVFFWMCDKSVSISLPLFPDMVFVYIKSRIFAVYVQATRSPRTMS